MRIDSVSKFGKTAEYLIVCLALLYAADCIVFEARLASGVGLGSVQVETYLKTSLKGNKAEYDFIGAADENCSRTVFPQYAASQWNPPCWWLKRHTQRWQ